MPSFTDKQMQIGNAALNAHLVEVWRTLCSLVDAMSRLQNSRGLFQKHHKILYTSFASLNAEPKAKVVISPEIE
jgi:hypothetical protein